MATVTTQERTNILKLVAGMFNAAPGAAYLNEFTNAYVDLNKDLGALANALGQTGAFQAMYPSFLTAEEFANKFLDTLGLKANTEAQDWVKAKVNAGESYASVIFQALVAIDASTADDFKAAREQLTNKAAVAEYYSVEQNKSADDLGTLQNVVATVTNDPATVEAAKQGAAVATGKTFTLTAGIDNIVGTAGNDTIKAPAVGSTGAAATTVTNGDVVDGGAGTDSLEITATATNNNNFTGLSVKNVEKITVTGADNVGATTTTTTTTSSPAVSAGAAQVIDLVIAAGASSGTNTVSVVINGVTYTTTYAGNTTAATALDNKATAIAGVFEKVLGGTVTVTNTGSGLGEVKLTSKAIGAPLPTISGTEGSSAAWSLDTTANAQVANAEVTASAAVAQVLSITTTFTAAEAGVIDLYVDGVNRGAIATTVSSTAATVSSDIATALNNIFGAGSAVALGGTVTLTAPAAGTPLPHISFFESDEIGGSVTVTVARNNVDVGATTTTTTTTTTGANIDANQFVGATEFTVDGKALTVKNLVEGQAVNFVAPTSAGQTGLVNTVSYKEGVTAATVNLTNVAGQITVDDASSSVNTTTLKTLNVNGTVATQTAANAAAHTAAVAGTVTLVDALSTADTITTLNLGLTTAATVDTAGMDALVTVSAAGSTGNLTISADETKLASVVGGAGNDKITVDFDTDMNASSGPKTATVDGGAGNDTIALSNNNFGTGYLVINGGAGDDTVKLASAALTARTTVNGGDGTDTFYFTPSTTALTAGELALITSQVSGVENARFATLTSADASKLSQFTGLQFDAGATVTKVANTQTVTVAADSIVQNAAHILKGTDAATATTYGGSLNAVATGGTAATVNATTGVITTITNATDVTLRAESATLTVKNVFNESNPDAGRTASHVQLTGDLKTATVVMESSADYATAPSADVISTLYVQADNTANSTTGSEYLTALGNLTSLTIKGVGNAVIDNTQTTSTASDSKLVTIDASAFGGVKSAFDTANAGKPLGSLKVATNEYLAETITLGSSLDVIYAKSTYDKMDTINNFSLKATALNALDTALSDDISIASMTSFAKVTAGITATTLGAALTEVAAIAGSGGQKVFQLNGDTYIFADNGSNSTLDANDTVVKLTGLVDLDLLVSALNA